MGKLRLLWVSAAQVRGRRNDAIRPCVVAMRRAVEMTHIVVVGFLPKDNLKSMGN